MSGGMGMGAVAVELSDAHATIRRQAKRIAELEAEVEKATRAVTTSFELVEKAARRNKELEEKVVLLSHEPRPSESLGWDGVEK